MINFDEMRVEQGQADAWASYNPDQPVGDPVGADESYVLGWWSGIGECQAWNEGLRAARLGLHVCPYAEGSDHECFREFWLMGYTDALDAGQCLPAAAGRMAS